MYRTEQEHLLICAAFEGWIGTIKILHNLKTTKHDKTIVIWQNVNKQYYSCKG